VGDVVYAQAHGKGVVKYVSKSPSDVYPVIVHFPSEGAALSTTLSFTADGKNYETRPRSLFFAPLEVNATHLNRPRPVFRPNNVVLNKRSGAIAVVSHDQASSNYTHLYRAGGTSGDTTTASSTDLQLIAETFIKE
jgi:hypothetical protein